MGLSVRLMGGFSASLDEDPLEIPRSRARLLLVYLLLHRQLPVDRGKLAGIFWGDSTEEQARTNLRRELHKLKRLLPNWERYIEISASCLAIRADAPVEVILDGKGDLLPNEEAPWLEDLRAELVEQRAGQLERDFALAENEGHLRRALDILQSLLNLDPLREDLHRHKMRLLFARGDRAAALLAYGRCREILDAELGVSPSETTRRLHDQLLNEDATSESKHDSTLVGRDRDWAIVQGWFESAQVERNPPALLLTGEPGIGKTRLLEELTSLIIKRGGTAFFGRSYEAEKHRPFAPWEEAVEGFAELVERGAEKRDRGRLFESLVKHLCQFPAPVVLILDDLQWVDEASVALLHFGFRSANLKVVGAARTAELDDNAQAVALIRALGRDRRLTRLPLGPLDENAIKTLAPGIEARKCGGNPLLALELSRSDHQGSQDLRELLAERLGRLSTQARELLSWSAALGNDFSALRLEKVCGRTLLELLPTLEELEKHAVLRPKGSNYDFVHDLVREAAYDELSEPRRRLLHLQIARALDGEAHPAEVAQHAIQAGDSELAARSAMDGARRHAKVLAFHEAFQMAALGLHQAEQLSGGWNLKVRLYQTMVAAGIPDPQEKELRDGLVELGRQLVEAGEDELHTQTVSLLAIWDYDRQRLDSVQQHSGATADLARHGEPRRAAQMLAHAGACLAAIGREIEKARALTDEAERLAERCGIEVVEIELTRGLLARFDGNTEEAVTRLARCLELVRKRKELWRGIVALTHLIMVHLEANQRQGVAELCQELLEASSRLGPGSEGPVARCFLALCEENEKAMGLALEELQTVDNRRMLAFCSRLSYAVFGNRLWLEQAYKSAISVEDVSEQALAGTHLAQLELKDGDRDQARQLFLELRELPSDQLSHRALEALTRLGRSWTRRGGYKDGDGSS